MKSFIPLVSLCVLLALPFSAAGQSLSDAELQILIDAQSQVGELVTSVDGLSSSVGDLCGDVSRIKMEGSGTAFFRGYDGFARLSTNQGTGSGFVVAFDATTRLAEIWTNAHVAGRVGTKPRIEFFREGRYQNAVVGETTYSILEGVADAAKVSVTIPVDIPDPYVFQVGDSDLGGGDYLCNFGCPRGGDPQSHVFNVRPESREGIVELKQPTIGGQSGSPLVDAEGKVRAIVTWNYQEGGGWGQPQREWGGASKLEWFDVGDGPNVRRTMKIPSLPGGFNPLDPLLDTPMETAPAPFILEAPGSPYPQAPYPESFQMGPYPQAPIQIGPSYPQSPFQIGPSYLNNICPPGGCLIR